MEQKIETKKDLVTFLSSINRKKLKIKKLFVQFWVSDEELENEGLTLTEFSMD
ncbi:MAG: hypothetical protein IJD90_00405 [Clostridia bacterium]|nr:hypothetical protein [Clostridia bacterium]